MSSVEGVSSRAVTSDESVGRGASLDCERGTRVDDSGGHASDDAVRARAAARAGGGLGIGGFEGGDGGEGLGMGATGLDGEGVGVNCAAAGTARGV